MNRLILQVFCAIFSGIAEGFAISNEILPFGAPFLALICLLPLYVAVFNSKSYKESFFIFGLQVLTVHLFSSAWLANFHGFGVFTLGASAFGTWFEGALFGIIIHCYPHQLLKNKKTTKSLYEGNCSDNFSTFKRILWFSSIFTLFEWEKSVGALGYPWGTISSAAYRFKILNQFVDITGVLGITFLYSLCSSFFGELYFYTTESVHYQKKENAKINLRQNFALISILYAICLLYGLFQYFIPRSPQKYVNTVIVQHNADSWGTSEDSRIRTAMALTEQAINNFTEETGEEADLVLWSEGILSKIFPERRNFYETNPKNESLVDFIKRMNTPFLIGGTSRPREKHTANSAILFDKNGKYSGYYSKKHLVPFAELIPYRESAIMKFIMQDLVKMDSSLMQGFQFVKFKIPLKENKDKKTPLDYNREFYNSIELDKNGNSNPQKTEKYITNNQDNPLSFVNFTTPICFEDAFPSVCRQLHNFGSEIFMNITNDSWSNTNSAEFQHFIIASYRSMELRTTLVRCCNSGYSAVIDARGRVIADLPLFKEEAAVVKVPVYEHKTTIYAKYGDWFVYLILAFSLLYMIYAIFDTYNLIPDFAKLSYRKKILKNNAESESAQKTEIFIQQNKMISSEFSQLKNQIVALENQIIKMQEEISTSAKKSSSKTKTSAGRKNLAEKNEISSPAKKSSAKTKTFASKKVSAEKTEISTSDKKSSSKTKSDKKQPK